MRSLDRQAMVAALLLQGCENQEIADKLGIARRTVKAHFNRMFLRYQITSGVKRVKLAVLLYRESWEDCEVCGARFAGMT